MNRKICQKVKVTCKRGLHARPATSIAKLLKHFESSVTFKCNNKVADAKEVLSLLLLQATEHSQIEMIIEGIDAEITLEKLSEEMNDLTSQELN